MIFKIILSALLWISFWVSSFIVITLLIIVSIFIPKKWYDPLIRLVCTLLSRSVFIFPVHKGISPKDVPFPVIYVANHVSFFDLFICGTCLPGNPRGVELKSHFSKPIYGWFITRFGEIPIDPTSKTSIKRSFENAKAILDNKIRSILMMPEGHRTRNGSIQPFRSGAFYLSRISNIPVVPVVFKDLYKRNNPASLLINPGKTEVYILDPVFPQHYQTDDEMGNEVRNIMIKKMENKS